MSKNKQQTSQFKNWKINKNDNRFGLNETAKSLNSSQNRFLLRDPVLSSAVFEDDLEDDLDDEEENIYREEDTSDNVDELQNEVRTLVYVLNLIWQ